MKLNRRNPCNVTPSAWFYVNEGSITVFKATDYSAVEVRLTRRHLLAALRAMRKRRTHLKESKP